MLRVLATGGERFGLESALDWVTKILVAGSVNSWQTSADPASTSIMLTLDGATRAFDHPGSRFVTRGSTIGIDGVVVENACGSGFDLSLRPVGERLEVHARWRPPPRERAAALILRDRFRLLTRQALMYYPVIWWAGVRGRTVLHAGALDNGRTIALLAGPGGVGKSTLVRDTVRAGGRATSDNLSVSDGETVWGIVEPMRLADGSGRGTTHGRTESDWSGRVGPLVPTTLLSLRRGDGSRPPRVEATSKAEVVRCLVAGTLMAGELRRYWSFGATLALATGLGPVAPHVEGTAAALADRLSCSALVLGPIGSRSLDVLDEANSNPVGERIWI